MKIIGHRGARGEAQENSLEAVDIAISAGVDMVEIDVRVSGDMVYLSHDKLEPNKSYITLLETLRHLNGKIPVNIDIKEFAVVEHLPELLDDYSGMVLLSSSDYKTLKYCRDRLPDTPVAIIDSWSGARATHRAKKLGTKRIHMNQRWLWKGFIASMSGRGWQLFAYTVNSTSQANSFRKAGLAGIFTDYPTKIVEFRNNK